jgi:hypothetical protein
VYIDHFSIPADPLGEGCGLELLSQLKESRDRFGSNMMSSCHRDRDIFHAGCTLQTQMS